MPNVLGLGDVKIPPEFVDKDFRLSYNMLMDDDGILKPELIDMFGDGAWTHEALKADRGLAAVALAHTLLKILPHTIPFNVSDGFSLTAIREWMRNNVHDAWILTIRKGETCFVFARDVDAIHFKMAWT